MERRVKYDVAFRLNCVKLNIEKYHSISSYPKKYGLNTRLVTRWIQNYRILGLQGLISTKNKRYTVELKLKVIRVIEQEKLSSSKAKFKFHIPNASIIIQWQNKYATIVID